MKYGFRRNGPRIFFFPRILYACPLFFLTASLLTSGCTRASQAAGATATDKHAAPQPPQVGPNTVTFRLAMGSVPVTGAHVELEGDMAHAGMAPVFGSAKEISPGQYQGQLVLNMPGDWVVLLHITLPDGRKLEEQMKVNGVQAK
jgi:hypothetical protein